MSRIIYASPKRYKRSFSLKRSFRVIFFAVAIFLLVAAVLYILRLPGLAMDTVNTSGSSVISPDEIRTQILNSIAGFYFFLVPRNNFILVNSTNLSKNLLDSFPRIAEAKIKKRPFKELMVIIKEREPWGIYCASSCVYIDESGFAFEEAPDTQGSLIKLIKDDNKKSVHLGTEVMPKNFIATAKELDSRAQSSGLGEVIEYDLVSSPPDLKVKTKEEFWLVLNFPDNYDRVFTVLKTVLDEEIKERRGDLDYIDLRFGNKVFYKFKSTAAK